MDAYGYSLKCCAWLLSYFRECVLWIGIQPWAALDLEGDAKSAVLLVLLLLIGRIGWKKILSYKAEWNL